MIEIKEFNIETEENLVQIIIEFNRLYSLHPETITQYGYYKLQQLSDKPFNVLDWRNFYTDPRVQKWYQIELDLALTAKMHKLTQDVGENHSTASQQTLRDLIKYKETSSNEIDDGKIFIFTHWPLTNIEEHIKNVHISEVIPKEINDAISIYEGTPKP